MKALRPVTSKNVLFHGQSVYIALKPYPYTVRNPIETAEEKFRWHLALLLEMPKRKNKTPTLATNLVSTSF